MVRTSSGLGYKEQRPPECDMRVLVVGSGGREHALAWKIAQSPRVERVLAAPGSDGIARDADCFPDVKAGDAAGLARLARGQGVDLVFVLLAPEESGADHLRALARVSRLLRDTDLRKKLRETSEAEALYALITEPMASRAA